MTASLAIRAAQANVWIEAAKTAIVFDGDPAQGGQQVGDPADLTWHQTTNAATYVADEVSFTIPTSTFLTHVAIYDENQVIIDTSLVGVAFDNGGTYTLTLNYVI